MNNPSGTNPIWNVLLALTILSGAAACFIALKRGDFFPSVYSRHEVQNHSTLANKHHEAEQRIAADSIEEREPTGQKKVSITAPPSQFVLVAGSFLSDERAIHFRKSLAQKFPKTEVIPIMRGNKQFYHVLIGRTENRNAILELQKKMYGQGFNDCWFYEMKDSL